MAKLYTQPELHQATLDGFNSDTTLQNALAPETAWQTVLSLTLIHETQDGALLIQDGIRRADANPTHPDVVSTPTGRVPKFIAKRLVEEKLATTDQADPSWRIDGIDPMRPKVVMQLLGNAESMPENEDLLPYLAGALLTRKLGCANSLELATSERPFGTVSLSTILVGFSYAADRYENSPDGGVEEVHLFEPLIMLGAVVNVYDKSAVPAETASYRSVSWVDLDAYKRGVEGREVVLLIPDIGPKDEASVCVRGLCLATSKAAITGGVDLRTHLGTKS